MTGKIEGVKSREYEKHTLHFYCFVIGHDWFTAYDILYFYFF